MYLNIFFFLLQVNNSKRLAELCGLTSDQKSTPCHCLCAIVTRGGQSKATMVDEDPPLSPQEQKLRDFYECTLEEFPRPVIQLPI